MVRVTYVAEGADEVTLDVAEGTSLMQAAVNNGVRGILAECGGQCQCATCHVYVADEFLDRLPGMTEDEDEMLDLTACERTANSRLSCQLVATPALEGIVVRLPKLQR